MKKSLSYVLVTPYAVAKNRTGGVLSRLLSGTDLELVGARTFVPDGDFAGKYAEALRKRLPRDGFARLADYAERNLAGPERALLLLFFGENPCGKLSGVCGPAAPPGAEAGGTIRDTFGDLILEPDGSGGARHFEPAVFTAECRTDADADMALFADFLEGRENIVKNLPHRNPEEVERTLVILKPDNWTRNSSRPGVILDMFSRTGLETVGVKVHRFSLAQALEFYGPVEAVLRDKLAGRYGKRARELLEREFGAEMDGETAKTLEETFGADCAVREFGNIVEFMCGKRPGSGGDPDAPGDVKCVILVYEGPNAVAKIRETLGPTNPAEAPDGTVRREFGSTVMINAAHASDSTESFLREKDVVRMDENTLTAIIAEHLGRG